MSKGFSFHSMKFKMVLVTMCVIILLTLVLGTLSFSQTKPAIESTVQTSLNSISTNVAEQIRSINDKQFTMLHALAKLKAVYSDDYTLQEKAAMLLKIIQIDPTYENVSFMDKSGMAYTHEGVLLDFSNRFYFTEAIKGNDVVTDPALSPVTKELTMYYAVPVYNENNEVVGILAAIVKGSMPSIICQNITIGKESHPIIMSMKTGKTIGDAEFKYVEEEQVLRDITTGGMQEAVTEATKGKMAYKVFYEPFRKKTMVSSYQPIEGTDWCIFCMAPYDDFFGFMTTMVRSLLVISVLGMVISILATGFIISRLLKPLINVDTSIHEIASGNADLTRRIKQTSKDEIGSVVDGFNKFTEKLQSIISQVKHSNESLNIVGSDLSASTEDTASAIAQIIANIESVHNQITKQSNSVQSTAGAVNEIASNIESLEHMIANQSSGVTQASAAVEEMIGNIASVNQSVDKMASSFESLQQTAVSGSAKQQDVNERIEQIEGQSEMLQEANQAIAAIAEQTNLLAMNAAIEAAHAGDSGKGFSVVADEIRKLSETSAQQSKTIGEQLNSIKDSIGGVVQASAESSVAFENVSNQIRQTDQLVRQIKAAMQEQNEGSKQISDALHAMNDSTSEVRNASAEMSQGNKQILEEVQLLQEATMGMKQSMDEMSVGARKINETGTALSDMSMKLQTSIEDIGKEINQFKV